MDIPVVLVKLRDYLLWFGPVYLVAISVGAASELAIRRFLALPFSTEEPEGKFTESAYARSWEPNLPLDIWLRISGRARTKSRVGTETGTGREAPAEVSLQLYLWAAVTSQSLSWVALLVTAQISWALSLIRLGLALVLASLLAALLPLISTGKGTHTGTGTGQGEVIVQVPRPSHGPPAASLLLPLQWWRLFQARFAESSNGLVLGAVLGALLFGLAPGIYAVLRGVLTGPLSYVSGPAIGMLAPLVPGTDAPLVAALQVKGADSGAIIALMLAVSATPWSLLRELKRSFGPRALSVYLVATGLLVALIAWLVEPIMATAGVI